MTDIADLMTPYTILFDKAKTGDDQAFIDLIDKLSEEIKKSNLLLDAKEVLSEILDRCVEVKTVRKSLIKNETMADFTVGHMVLRYHCWGYPLNERDNSAYDLAAKDYEKIHGHLYEIGSVKDLWQNYNAWNNRKLNHRNFKDRHTRPQDYKTFRIVAHQTSVSYFIAHCLDKSQSEEEAIKLAAKYVHGEYGGKKSCLEKYKKAWEANRRFVLAEEDDYLYYKSQSQLPDNLHFGTGIPEGFF